MDRAYDFKLLPFPRQFNFDLILDEMPLYRIGCFRGGCISGVAEITYDRTGWHVSDLHIAVDNGRIGANAESKSVHLDGQSEPLLYEHMLDRITEDYATNIEETISMELAEAA
jgi:hypothetical protein